MFYSIKPALLLFHSFNPTCKMVTHLYESFTKLTLKFCRHIGSLLCEFNFSILNMNNWFLWLSFNKDNTVLLLQIITGTVKVPITLSEMKISFIVYCSLRKYMLNHQIVSLWIMAIFSVIELINFCPWNCNEDEEVKNSKNLFLSESSSEKAEKVWRQIGGGNSMFLPFAIGTPSSG